ncbi:hypothetical protein DNTS_016946 [Danionella cerebrum]|uniref:Uncharacterized protein n=1 Tax=Danionella cerebrum TaxID=2873325 RepID=A0A553QG05_9TELE|nr:hypothetical protein DNTS_016946 [Danionella translucida]
MYLEEEPAPYTIHSEELNSCWRSLLQKAQDQLDDELEKVFSLNVLFQMGSSPSLKPPPLFLDVCCRGQIILCIFLSIILSSLAVCDGHWLLSGRQIFGLWFFCQLEVPHGSELGPLANCSRRMEDSGVEGLSLGLASCRSVVALGVVSAIFGLELLVMSQASDGGDSRRRWVFGARLVLLAGLLAAAGLLMFLLVLREMISILGFTLTFWCQVTASFLFLLSGMAARHIQKIQAMAPPLGHLEKPMGV